MGTSVAHLRTLPAPTVEPGIPDRAEAAAAYGMEATIREASRVTGLGCPPQKQGEPCENENCFHSDPFKELIAPVKPPWS